MLAAWLIARGFFNEKSIRYDYMGSAEFENGSIPKSWKRLSKSTLKTHEINVTVNLFKPLTLYVVTSDGFDMEKYEPFFQKMVDNKLQLKERSEVDKAARVLAKVEKSKWPVSNVWHDIESDVLFSFEKDLLKANVGHIIEFWKGKE